MKKILIIFITATALAACNKTLDRYLINPNGPTPDQANADLYLTRAQLSFAGFFNTASGFGMELTRQIVLYGPLYDNAYSPQTMDGIWNTAYTGVIKHCDALIPIADEQKKYVNVAMAKIMKAYTYMTMVDLFGDVPFSEANIGVDNLNPKTDPGAEIYAGAIALLDEAIADLGKPTASFPGNQDLFYGTTGTTGVNRWKTVAKTLKLRAYIATRLVDPTAKAKIEALLTENDLIDSDAEDFEFKYGKKDANPNSRHPRYNGNHTSTGAGDYIGTYFMWTLVQEKGQGDANNDPRSRFYLYRQETNYAAVTENTINCYNQPPPANYPTGQPNPYTGGTYDMPFCLLIQGYWGRDHGDDSGIPPDGQLRTTVGVYPFGGRFDNNQGANVAVNSGANGAGIQPIWLSSFTEFLKAEYELILNSNAANARARLESGVRKSINKVINFPAVIGHTEVIPTTRIPDAARIDAYVNKVLNAYDAAATTDAKLDIIMKDYYIALWGNGVDAYNMYRRTNKPANMQLLLTPVSNYMNSLFYPSVHINRNTNAVQKSSVAVQVFWDTNPPNSRK
jgi:SusD/RagB-like outer membrane lipoprotein